MRAREKKDSFDLTPQRLIFLCTSVQIVLQQICCIDRHLYLQKYCNIHVLLAKGNTFTFLYQISIKVTGYVGEYLFTRFGQKSSHLQCFIIQHESHTSNSEFYYPFLTIFVCICVLLLKPVIYEWQWGNGIKAWISVAEGLYRLNWCRHRLISTEDTAKFVKNYYNYDSRATYHLNKFWGRHHPNDSVFRYLANSDFHVSPLCTCCTILIEFL